MSILKPTVGELLDRLCVLELKIEAFADAGFAVEKLEAERGEILERLPPLAPAEELLRNLRGVHRFLWEKLDRMAAVADRGWVPRYDDWKDVSTLGIEIFQLNRTRAELRQHIDVRFGQYAGPEKLYGPARERAEAV